MQETLIAVVDGLRGFPEAIEAVYPQAQIQTCIVHLIRDSLNLASRKDRRGLAAALKAIYQAATVDAAAQSALQSFTESERGKKFPAAPAIWQQKWEQVIPFFAYPLEVRKIIYTTNAIESMHMRLREIAKNRGHFPSDEAASKLLYLAWPCAISRKIGRCDLSRGSKPSINSPSCSANDSPTRCTEIS